MIAVQWEYDESVFYARNQYFQHDHKSRNGMFEFGPKSMCNGLYELISSYLIVVLMVITNRNWKIEPFETGRHVSPFYIPKPFLIQRLSIESLARVGYI